MKNIKGYRTLSCGELQDINDAKELESVVLSFLDGIKDDNIRWKSIARTHFEQGFMALVRSIAKPE